MSSVIAIAFVGLDRHYIVSSVITIAFVSFDEHSNQIYCVEHYNHWFSVHIKHMFLIEFFLNFEKVLQSAFCDTEIKNKL